jgi:DTW domain-containing protein YfiP
MTTQWTGFADYVESFGSKPSGGGNAASFEAMLEAALAAEEASQEGSQLQSQLQAPEVVEEQSTKTYLVHELPMQLEAEELMSCTGNDSLWSSRCREEVKSLEDKEERAQRHYRLTCGLLVKTRLADIRMVKQGMMIADLIDFNKRTEQTVSVFGTQIRTMCCEEDRSFLDEAYDDASLYDTAVELVAKRLTLSKKLCDVMEAQMLPPREAASGLLGFEDSFVDTLRYYFRSLQKPLLTSESGEVMHTTIAYDEAMMAALLALPREQCTSCSSYRALFCPECNGLRTQRASNLLPPRISRTQLPFDVLMLLHYQERSNRSTGAHSLALVEEGTVQTAHWPREKEGAVMEAIIEAIDPTRDLLLFPDDSAVPIAQACSRSPGGEEEGGRPRLILLEGNWTYAAKMASYIKKRVSGLRSVCLEEGVVGTYWRFQSVGVSALSTIEALYHACEQARSQQDKGEQEEAEEGRLDRLLILFEYQRRKVIDGDRKNLRGIKPTGEGPSDWGPYIDS